MNYLYLESNPSSGGLKAHHPAGFEPITAISWGMCSTTEPQPPPNLHIQLLHHLFPLGNKSKLSVSESRTRSYKENFSVDLCYTGILGLWLAETGHETLSSNENAQILALRKSMQKFSRKVTQWSCRVSNLAWIEKEFFCYFSRMKKNENCDFCFETSSGEL